ncbi:hypothetical protein MHU86_14010 [Fragilaria crotonensis]|nr:hypothetical protein MHU86_14010 [Fragilaria crotonensis]
MQLNNKHIVCGRGQRNYNNEGNRICRRVVERRLAQYMDKATGRTAKTKLVDATTRELFKMNMVFVTRTSDGSDWVRLSNGKARTKVAHLFRDASRQARRYSDGNFNSTNAGVMPSASDSDESWSLSSIFSSDDENFVAALSDSAFNNDAVASPSTMSNPDFEDENSSVASIGAIGAIGARSRYKLSSQQQYLPDVVNSPDSLGPPLSLETDYPGALESTFIDNELMPYSATRKEIARSVVVNELEAHIGDSQNISHKGSLPEAKLLRSISLLPDGDLDTLCG